MKTERCGQLALKLLPWERRHERDVVESNTEEEMTMTKSMMDLPMNTKSTTCTCGGPAKYIETVCPCCGEKGMRVKAGTVRYLLTDTFREQAVEKIYGLCLSPDCSVAWYAQDGSHHFTVDQTDTPIWSKRGAEPAYICYCNRITREMIRHGVAVKGLRTMEEIVLLHRSEVTSACATRHPAGQCCEETFAQIIAEEVKESLGCRCS
ncbi:(2Fe-2S)-binding protein [Pseudodesulfovibrio piezophilus]|uniref:CopZ zinc binding domain-containing protein n=1 Tax=Pseudodesulfovibrio piezophilus (strain DSM 21447 / JCM 15486 / C1TLV30) TaxID=1322246 RepID=M1WWD0_PSEP2|nr:(2Fe-2S)-binding protein [Pseudodesulfovibrio piezophilus]CCH49073.1 protein of unknown function [Pseudodesulfovibrio piezophilus C1TLV30]